MINGVVNFCRDCKAVREYPDGEKLIVCPRCNSSNLSYSRRPQNQEESNKALIDAIEGNFNPLMDF